MITPGAQPRSVESIFLAALILVVSLVFAWLVTPFFGAIVWGVVAAIMFTPLNDRLKPALGGRANLAAGATLLIILVAVILPAMLLGGALLQHASTIYAKVKAGQIDFDRSFLQLEAHLPLWMRQQLDAYGLGDLAAVRGRIAHGVASSFQTLAAQAYGIGQSTFAFFLSLGIMLYLTFFLLRDGRALAARIERSIPLLPDQRRALLGKFSTVVRATVKGSLVVAFLQGAIGGLTFWVLGIGGALLWGILMGVLSLLPAIGTAFVWAPVAVYLLVTGAVWQGVAVALCGFFIISSVDNVVKPILVGRDTRMPDYVVLISTFGGLELFGFNGLIVGPVIAALFMASWEIFSDAHASPATKLDDAGHVED